MKIHVSIPTHEYDIVLERGALHHLNDYITHDGKILLLSDHGVPKEYIDLVASQFSSCYPYIVEQGEQSKTFPVYESILTFLLENDFQRKDCVIALGGGVVGDLGGFVAASYMRGIRFINLPTTTLSQVDSSIGGKVAINLQNTKNIVGTFYQPSIVIIDPDVLKTLPHRHVVNGLVEALKAGLILDPSLYALFLEDPLQQIDEIIYRSLEVKRKIVEQDEKETGLRKKLNFGHTIGHGLESYYHLGELLHGEAVALGMLYFIEDEATKAQLKCIYQALSLPIMVEYKKELVWKQILHDKKANANTIDVVIVSKPGISRIESMSFDEVKTYL